MLYIMYILYNALRILTVSLVCGNLLEKNLFLILMSDSLLLMLWAHTNVCVLLYGNSKCKQIFWTGWGLSRMMVWRGFAVTLGWNTFFLILATAILKLRTWQPHPRTASPQKTSFNLGMELSGEAQERLTWASCLWMDRGSSPVNDHTHAHFCGPQPAAWSCKSCFGLFKHEWSTSEI